MYLPNFEKRLADAASAVGLQKRFAVLPPARSQTTRRAMVKLALETLEEMLPADGYPAERQLKGAIGRILFSRLETDAIAAEVDEQLVNGAGRRAKLETGEEPTLTEAGMPVATRREVALRVVEILNHLAPHY